MSSPKQRASSHAASPTPQDTGPSSDSSQFWEPDTDPGLPAQSGSGQSGTDGHTAPRAKVDARREVPHVTDVRKRRGAWHATCSCGWNQETISGFAGWSASRRHVDDAQGAGEAGSRRAGLAGREVRSGRGAQPRVRLLYERSGLGEEPRTDT
ncbi:MAG: hypothetical protein ACRDV4_08310 [Acidimicrobiales bacterium]